MLDKSLRFEIAALQSPGAESEFGSDADGRPLEIESHFNRLLDLWKRLESITDRAYDVKSRSLGRSQDFELLAIAALREAEYADLTEQRLSDDPHRIAELNPLAHDPVWPGTGGEGHLRYDDFRSDDTGADLRRA